MRRDTWTAPQDWTGPRHARPVLAVRAARAAIRGAARTAAAVLWAPAALRGYCLTITVAR